MNEVIKTVLNFVLRKDFARSKKHKKGKKNTRHRRDKKHKKAFKT